VNKQEQGHNDKKILMPYIPSEQGILAVVPARSETNDIFHEMEQLFLPCCHSKAVIKVY
jgi:hypothetical protein